MVPHPHQIVGGGREAPANEGLNSSVFPASCGSRLGQDEDKIRRALPYLFLLYEAARGSVRISVFNEGRGEAALVLRANAYSTDGPWTLRVPLGQRVEREWELNTTQNWYDFSATGQALRAPLCRQDGNGEIFGERFRTSEPAQS